MRRNDRLCFGADAVNDFTLPLRCAQSGIHRPAHIPRGLLRPVADCPLRNLPALPACLCAGVQQVPRSRASISQHGVRPGPLQCRLCGVQIARAQRLVQIAEDGTATLSKLPDVRQLDLITRALGDVAEREMTGGLMGRATNLGRVYGNLSREIRDSVKGLVPAYETALNSAADAISRVNATKTGRDLLLSATTREDVARGLYGVSQAERRAAQQGVRSYVDDAMANVRRTIGDPDVTTRQGIQVLRDFSSEANITKMRVLLGQGPADTMLSQIDEAATAFELRAAIAENSKTARRLQITTGVREGNRAGLLPTLMAGEPINAGKRVVQLLTGETAEARQLRDLGVFEEIARALTETRGARAASALRLINRAIDGQSTLTQMQAQHVTNALLATGLTAGRVPDALLVERRANSLAQ